MGRKRGAAEKGTYTDSVDDIVERELSDERVELEQ